MKKEIIKRVSFKEAESKFCVGTFPACDGSYHAELNSKEIKEAYLVNCIHTDEFIQVLEYQVKRAKKKLNEAKENSNEYLFLLGNFIALENTIKTFYNTGNVAQSINK